MNEITTGLLEETRELWNTGKKVMVQVAWNLFQLRELGDWKESSDTFPKFCDEQLGIKQSQTSKLLTIADYFLREKTPEEIGAIDYELLYAAAKLPGTVDENLAKAKTLTRDDLKKEKAEVAPHTPDWCTYCATCGLAQTNHP